MTVRETLKFVARLEDTTDGVDERVDQVARKLGLMESMDTVVGGDGVRGISGGEKRRLAIACELLRASVATGEGGGAKDLTVLIADEPTTGLDSFQADKVVSQLTGLAHDRSAMVLMCIHQPRSAIYEKLDDVLLLAPGGRTCFMGPAREAVAHFGRLGFVCKQNFNPAEFLVDLVSIDTSSEEAERKSWKRVEHLSEVWRKSPGPVKVHPVQAWPDFAELPSGSLDEVEDEDETAVTDPVGERKSRRRKKRAGILGQFFQLVKRSFTITRRESQVHLTRAVGTVILALAFGTCHFKLGRGQKSIKKRGAVMMQVCINSAMMSTIKTLNSFPKERAVVRKELSKTRKDGSRLYGIGPYFLSKLLIETPVDAFFPILFGSIVGPLSGLNPKTRIPFLGTLALQGVSASAVGMSVGALAPNTETALAIGPVVMVLSIMLGDSGGMFAEVPLFLRPAAKYSLIKWGFDGCSSAEFTGLRFHCDDLDEMMPSKGKPKGGVLGRGRSSYQKEIADAVCLRTGKQVLEGMGLQEGSWVDAAREQGRLIGLNLAATYLLLNLKDRRSGSGRCGEEPPIPFDQTTKGRKLWEI
ncbi:ABC-2 type transporter [Chloropicon primus]|uniref:ABC-2 type transporter n=2 Tax=Chloropicon primus TaxID=1764295 RepID=A0A5B8N073_9CHLO|nr:ABC-2 type transporter [Chloropicon primus]UPR04580.1 ABC-2 type transporter [Chloropicon primus]|eukprot:QDZ25382.1 ABC-2 type transporter [Chloropicon primus]